MHSTAVHFSIFCSPLQSFTAGLWKGMLFACSHVTIWTILLWVGFVSLTLVSLKAKHFTSVDYLHFLYSQWRKSYLRTKCGGPTFNTRHLALIFVSDENLLIIVLYFPNYLIKLCHTKANRQVKNSQRLFHITVTIPQTHALHWGQKTFLLLH